MFEVGGGTSEVPPPTSKVPPFLIVEPEYGELKTQNHLPLPDIYWDQLLQSKGFGRKSLLPIF